MTRDLPPPPSGLIQDSSWKAPSLSILSSPSQISSCKPIKSSLAFCRELLGGFGSDIFYISIFFLRVGHRHSRIPL
ncbi:hypothetical protein EV05_0262 [Prochlorococcus sp. MIT 0601]|nr:hypothetical protein EV05_0262 [Prochlorococcus sp. MIT 0601]